MNNTCIFILLFVALVSCALSSYLDIPPPPERPARFKTKEQIETYLKAVKDYYDAFKIKLVRRENSYHDYYSHLDKLPNEDSNGIDDDGEDETSYYFNQSPLNSLIQRRRRYRIKRLMNI
ncbi:unnamed protein product [Adineta steineri]|uniref:Uncharacterized protein n=1 Tax=Adineta steineri TaxID=433720 RepID=A0A818Q876_9BILA|nr:unnamed protein product [Adineta steineri]CAF0861105.1 unnamed protein product [Adineta steineri]CAF1023728.1 unnamed protein product [Adineta steineri]CAF1170597.1 unnamed protein product [Adineta steineri]CAF3492213.1 unnamed protein product [Adineta steineri]